MESKKVEPRYLSEKEASIYTGIKVRTLRSYRAKGLIPFLKVYKLIRYDKEDLNKFMQQFRVINRPSAIRNDITLDLDIKGLVEKYKRKSKCVDI